MCSVEEKSQLVLEGKMVAFKKTSFYITTGFSLLFILAGFIISFTTVKLQATDNTKRIEINSSEIKNLKSDRELLLEIKLNVKGICEALNKEYLEINTKLGGK